jgi:hypothetical protein
MNKVVYYETDSSAPSTSDVESTSSKRQECKKCSKIPLCYPHISKRAPLLFVPLGKPPFFMVKTILYGVQAPQVGDEDFDSNEVAQVRHFNYQATSILLVSLCREEYNKVQGLKSAKEIWDILKTTHEGDKVTKITKQETIEGELSRFVLNKGQEPQAMYNRLLA